MKTPKIEKNLKILEIEKNLKTPEIEKDLEDTRDREKRKGKNGEMLASIYIK